MHRVWTCACLSQLDAAVGRLLASLAALHVRDNTLLLLSSDNGPEHRETNSWGSAAGLRGAKGFVYEGGIRVPFLLQWPRRLTRPAVLRTPVHFWDLLPTLCAAAGVAPPASLHLDGMSLLPLLLPLPPHARATVASAAVAAAAAAAAAGGGTVIAAGGGAVIAAGGASTAAGGAVAAAKFRRNTPLWWAMHRGRGGMQYALRQAQWKLLARYVGALPGGEVTAWLPRARLGGAELYSLRTDPQERLDLAAARPRLAARMLRRLQRLVREAARDGPQVVGWTQRPPPCPRSVGRWNAQLNLTEHCCQPLPWSELHPSAAEAVERTGA